QRFQPFPHLRGRAVDFGHVGPPGTAVHELHPAVHLGLRDVDALVYRKEDALRDRERSGILAELLELEAQAPIQPSPSAAARRIASGWWPPSQSGGCGFCTGLITMPMLSSR